MKDSRSIHEKTQELISVIISQFERKEGNELFPNTSFSSLLLEGNIEQRACSECNPITICANMSSFKE